MQKFYKSISVVSMLILFLLASITPNCSIGQTISSFSPLSGAVYSSVTITGTGFNATASNNIVHVGGVKASVSAASATSLTITIPSGTPSTASISVVNTATNLQAIAPKMFNITLDAAVGFTISSSNFSTTNTFTSTLNNNSGGTMRRVADIADMDGDGKPDIVSVGPSQVGILRNSITPGAAFSSGSFASVFTLATPGSSYDMALADINNDGKIDIVIGNSSSVSIFINTSVSGTLSFASIQTFTVTGPNVKIADMDNDGKLDIISCSSTSANTAYILRNTTTGGSNTLSFASAFSLTGFGSAMDFCVADMNKDGKEDLVAVNASSMNVFINTSTSGSLSFNAAVNVTGSFSGASYSVMSVQAGDLDNDGDLDLVVGNNGTTTSILFTNNYSSGAFLASSLSASNFTVGGGGQFSDIIELKDLDGDGRPEIIMENSNSANIFILQNQYTSGSLSSANFGAQVTISASTPQSVVSSDLNQDGKPDLINAQYFSSNIVVYSNTSSLSVLPINFISFTGNSSTEGNKLNWTISNCLGPVTYQIEKSKDAIEYNTIGTLRGNADCSGSSSYSYLDANTSSGISYYRIKEIDPDGNYVLSKTVDISSQVRLNNFSIYPNPTGGMVTVTGDPSFKNATIKLFSSSGNLLKEINSFSGNDCMLFLSGYPTGVYYLQINQQDKQFNTTLLKQ
ncbi:MAG: VCBS repeat-containing protein [Bacteroidetes bacterium]|nr:VCBS repeat-containing protein [Bacteroidota bacterium]